MKGNNKTYLMDILGSTVKIEEFVKGITYESFLSDEKTQSAIERKLEIIGEAAKRISQSFKEKHPEIPWKDMTGMRDKVIHDYPEIEVEDVWKTAKDDIPRLKEQIQKMLKEEF